MGAIGSIVMYSGRADPSTELSDEVTTQISELLYKLEEKAEEGIKTYKLGFRGYMVYWGSSGYAPPAVVRVHEGIVDISCFGKLISYKDTVGLEQFLKESLAECLQNHFDEATKAMEEYNEKMFGIPE